MLQRAAGAQKILKFFMDKTWVKFCEEAENERNLLTMELLFQRAKKGEGWEDNSGRIHHHHVI